MIALKLQGRSEHFFALPLKTAAEVGNLTERAVAVLLSRQADMTGSTPATC